jgi:AcrR family transcriptional regulator
VAQLGYARATVADIVVHARLSRRTFYEHFEDKESAVLAAFDAGLDRARAAILTAYDAHERFPDRVEAAVVAFVELICAEPDLARFGLVEIAAAGPRALERRERALAEYGERLRAGAESSIPDGVVVPPLTADLVVGGLCQIAGARVMTGRPGSLVEDIPEMVYCALVPFVGHREAGDRAAALAGVRA